MITSITFPKKIIDQDTFEYHANLMDDEGFWILVDTLTISKDQTDVLNAWKKEISLKYNVPIAGYYNIGMKNS